MARALRSGVQARIDPGSTTGDKSWAMSVAPPTWEPALLPAKASSQNHLDSLDGLRALSILLVLISHSAGALRIAHPMYLFGYLGHLGVSIFFVISGLLISWLMIREREATGSLSLRDFYIRRSLRILPVFWLFLLCVTALKSAHVISISGIDILRAFTFTRNYPMWVHGQEYAWWLNHAWSLSLEEQFYLVWPSLFAYLSRKGSRYFAVGTALAGPALRVGSYYLLPSLRGYGRGMFHTSIDVLMMGCVAAFVLDSPRWRERLKKIPVNTVVLASIVFLLGLEPFVLGHVSPHTPANSVADIFMPTFEGGMIAACVLVLVSGAGGVVRSFLNQPMAMHVGKISYGLYLWQQFFFFPGSASSLRTVLWRWPAVYLISVGSFHFLERPMQGLRKKFRRVSVE
jgi:peptidoglycan/LPS O-acetylase OafA/YrhL